MKILYLAKPCLEDCDFPLLKWAWCSRSYTMASFLLMITLFDTKKRMPKTTIFPAMKYPEFSVYESFMEQSKVNIASRTTNK